MKLSETIYYLIRSVVLKDVEKSLKSNFQPELIKKQDILHQKLKIPSYMPL